MKLGENANDANYITTQGESNLLNTGEKHMGPERSRRNIHEKMEPEHPYVTREPA